MKTKFNNKYLQLAFASLLILPAANNHAALTRIASVNKTNVQGNFASNSPSVSADGILVTFASDADNLLPAGEDTNGKKDVFVRNRLTGEVKRVSVASDKTQANGNSFSPVISADGIWVAFVSEADSLLPSGQDKNGKNDVFVHNLATGQTILVSQNTSELQANDHSDSPSISANGGMIAFGSFATNLVPNDKNGKRDVFVRNIFAGNTVRVSVDSLGKERKARSFQPSISASGRVVGFTSSASLVPTDTNGVDDIYAHNLLTKQTTLVSVDNTGNQGTASSFSPSLNANGNLVTFSSASPLVAEDTDTRSDIYMRNLAAGKTSLISVDSAGKKGNLASFSPTISADGQVVAFESVASNLVSNDTNKARDVFVRSIPAGITSRVSVSSAGVEGNLRSDNFSISADGRTVVFESQADNLVGAGLDTNNASDVFINDRVVITDINTDIQLAVTKAPTSIPSGQIASYTFTISNKGSAKANKVTLTDVFSRGIVTKLTPSQGICRKSVVSVCRLGTLAAGASATLTVNVKAVGKTLVQRLRVSAAPKEIKPLNNGKVVRTLVTP